MQYLILPSFQILFRSIWARQHLQSHVLDMQPTHSKFVLLLNVNYRVQHTTLRTTWTWTHLIVIFQLFSNNWYHRKVVCDVLLAQPFQVDLVHTGSE